MRKLFHTIKALFDMRAVLWSMLAVCIDYFVYMLEIYSKEIAAIDKSAANRFGVNLSSQFSFTEVLASAKFSYLSEFIGCFIIVFLPILGLIHLVRKCVVREPHPGWRRLGIVMPIILTIWRLFSAPSYYKLSWFLIDSIAFSFVGLITIVATRWIYSGFIEKRENQ